MVQDASKAWILIGAVSFGLGCGLPTQYGVYAEVGNDPLRSWVKTNTSQMSTAGGPVERPAPQAPAQQSGGAQQRSASQPPASEQPAPASGATQRSSSAPAAAAAALARLTIQRRVGSARIARRRGRVLVDIRSTRNLRALRVTLRQRRRTVAVGRRELIGRAVLLRMRIREGLRPGGAILTLTARDDLGRRVAVVSRVTLRR
jgi:hypothetical protein